MIEQYKTSDMTIASVLAYFGEEMIDVAKDIRGNIEFTFKQSDNLNDIIKAYMLDEISISPKRFSIVLKDIKRIIFSHKNNH